MALRCFPNPNHGTPGVVVLNAAGFRRARAAITAWPGYAPTPLHALPQVARDAGVAAVHLKDESPRFGLGSVKALGGAYAVGNLVCAELSRHGGAQHATPASLEAGEHPEAARITVCCASDGSHGRSVAWGARRFGAGCVVFVPAGAAAAGAAIAAFGAQLRGVPGPLEDAMREAAGAAGREGWCLVSDTAHPGYTEIPREIMQGYRLTAAEAVAALPEPPTHVLVPAGTGGVAAAVSVQLRTEYGAGPALIVVEPDGTACLLPCAEGRPTAPGRPSLVAWQELERSAAAFLAIPDGAADAAGRRLAAQGIGAGGAGLAALLLAAADPEARAALRLDGDSRVLLFGTEGAVGPAAGATG